MSYTKLFQRNNTYGRCEFEYNISQADNRSFMLPTLWIMKILRCRQAISQPFFFTLPRYEILFRVTPAPTTAKTHHTAEASIRSCSTTQQSTCIFVDVLCFIFDSKYVVLFGQRVQDCDDGAAMWRGCGYDPFPLQEKLNFAPVFFRLIVGVCYEMFFSFAICVCFRGGSFPKCRWWEDDAKGAAMWRIFCAGLTLNSIGLVGFWMNILFSARELFCGLVPRCVEIYFLFLLAK